ncbi:nitrile hydratase subunit beta [Bosea caraganae]|uniref:Nitrile hydratase subunit beta n=1 Tax=Bosea caraganae TaxID=2763117 RepID=A0A370LBC1_9HYPH|nr:nitrile hydratase subunit beta [Bosea caraganae]RDJ21774.1 nitrile hydratase subunit beta [Bosea caraganae]RDJ28196.1 nitrile hydratase subunit beta [Bosea caraganae]
MNGAQDLGGQMGFGPVNPEQDEPLYHAAWEPRAMALTVASGGMGHWTIDESRHARESLRPADYLSSSYYEIWIKGLSTLLERHGFLSAGEMASGEASLPPIQPKRVLKAEMVSGALAKGGPTERPAAGPQRFQPGDTVRTINMNPTGHTRLPRYARAKQGTVVLVHGAHVFPDASAHGGGEQPQWLYTVEFSGPELWGRGADPTLSVSIDAWESYLEPA